MTLKRFSLFYLVGYLVPTGIGLLLVPDMIFRMMFSNGHFGDVMPRMAGALVLALGILVTNIIVRRVDALFPALVIARVMLVSTWLVLYSRTGDPFFVAVAGVVGFGLLLTLAGLWRERSQVRNQQPAPPSRE